MAVPSAPECFKDIDLMLDQAGIGGGDRLVQGHEGLFRGQQVEAAHRSGHILIMRDVERAMDPGRYLLVEDAERGG